LGTFERSKHVNEAKVAKRSGPKKYESFNIYPEKLTHFQIRQEAEICQTYRGTTQTIGKNLKPGIFYPGGYEMGDRMCNI
jgi:hypothetical protein